MRAIAVVLAWACLCSSLGAQEQAAARAAIASFVDRHCAHCHDADSRRGGVDFDKLCASGTDADWLANARLWRHAAWRARRARAIELGSVPSQHVRTATEIAGGIWQPGVVQARTGKVALAHTDVPREGRPRGKRFGVLVHATLAEVSLVASESDAHAMATIQGRLVGATLAEVDAAKSAVTSALAHPLMLRAAKASIRAECRRETPVVMPLEGGAVLDGVIDLAFREDTPEGPLWTVIDFKTDTDVDAHGAQYEVQVSLYVDAIQLATGERATGVLLAV